MFISLYKTPRFGIKFKLTYHTPLITLDTQSNACIKLDCIKVNNRLQLILLNLCVGVYGMTKEFTLCDV